MEKKEEKEKTVLEIRQDQAKNLRSKVSTAILAGRVVPPELLAQLKRAEELLAEVKLPETVKAKDAIVTAFTEFMQDPNDKEKLRQSALDFLFRDAGESRTVVLTTVSGQGRTFSLKISWTKPDKV